jgi:hypothetical protein
MRRNLLRNLLGLPLFITLALVFLGAQSPTDPLQAQLIGSWRLVSRQTTLLNGQVVTDPGLSATPNGILIYDQSGHVAAQLSRPGRTVASITQECANIQKVKGTNDTAQTVLGYDAYFGTYKVDIKRGIVIHHLESALFPEDVGKDIPRHFSLEGDKLTIDFNTTTSDGTQVKRTLVWSRLK